jgi:hypothetical protein
MASIDSVTLDKASYAPGDSPVLTVNYTPDAPSNVPQTHVVTVTLSDASGNQVAAPATTQLVVNVPQPAGDKTGVTDDGNHAWAEQSDTGSVAVWSTTV